MSFTLEVKSVSFAKKMLVECYRGLRSASVVIDFRSLKILDMDLVIAASLVKYLRRCAS
jgi:hypothetical protein